MKSSNDPGRREGTTPGSLGADDRDADSLDGRGFTDEMHDGEGEADDRIGVHTEPSDDGGSGSR